MYLLMRVKSLMSLKVRSNLGPPKKIQNPLRQDDFLKIMLKVNLLMGIRRFSYNFSKIYSKTRVSELATPARSSWVHTSERPKRSLSKSS